MSKIDIYKNEKRLKQELKNYKKNIKQYRNALENESIWLFLAALGCWSVQGYLQFFSFFITITFFSSKIYNSLKIKKTFNGFEKNIIELIKKEFKSGAKKDEYEARLKSLQHIRQSNKETLKATPKFMLSCTFLALSIVYLSFNQCSYFI